MPETVHTFEELESIVITDDDANFVRCDLCAESSCDDLAGAEVRPFYRALFFGQPYTVCVKCLDQWMEEPCR